MKSGEISRNPEKFWWNLDEYLMKSALNLNEILRNLDKILMKSGEISRNPEKFWWNLMKSVWNLNEILGNLDKILMKSGEISRNPEKFWWNLDENLMKSVWNLNEILIKSWSNSEKSWEKPDEIWRNLKKSWEILNEIQTSSINFRRNLTVSGRNPALSGVSLSMDPGGSGSIWRLDATGTDRIFSDVIRSGIR
jgi:hypothetical protein